MFVYQRVYVNYIYLRSSLWSRIGIYDHHWRNYTVTVTGWWFQTIIILLILIVIIKIITHRHTHIYISFVFKNTFFSKDMIG